MPRFQKPKIAQFTYVIHFKDTQEKIRWAQGDAEVAFGSFGAGQSQQTNVPDNVDPSVPRILFMKDNRNIAISQQAVQLTHTFDAKATPPLDGQLEELRQEIGTFYEQALEFERDRPYGSASLIVIVNFGAESTTEELHKFVFERFIKFDPLGDLASVQFAVGFKAGDFYVNLNGAVYETRQFEMTQQIRGPITPANLLQSAQHAKLLGRGVQFTVDINDRPRFAVKGPQPRLVKPDSLFDRAKQIITAKLPSIIDGAN
ncbi:hypothetical protein DM81_2644 [Burkholderia multivorans]|uniref:hypothetical protein n=1 Tax=Burkholderia multivorans TaxID=87883 RepID=UPI00050EC597|nr:hypothetical protein [Burkholderia multivorans]KGB97859.1 hypothetical protein DM81_2644 [Burkholderia multivorans]